jgi:hypothetical protein
MKKIFVLFFLFNVLKKRVESKTSDYVNNAIMILPDIYQIFWNYTDIDITIEIRVKTTGWVLFGFSPNGEIDGSDLIVTWVNPDGSYYFKDSYVKKNVVYSDHQQNWFPLMVKQQASVLVAKFTRKIKLCDSNGEDFDITDGTPRVLAALGYDKFHPNLKGATFTHSVQSINLINRINEKIILKSDEILIADFRVNVNILS